VLLGHDQDVNGSLGADVSEREHPIILKNFFRGQCALNDFAKDTLLGFLSLFHGASPAIGLVGWYTPLGPNLPNPPFRGTPNRVGAITKLRSVLPPIEEKALPKGGANISSVMILIGVDPVTQREEILLTKRTHTVETHKGQVSFPGGYWETSDPHLLATALRECDEEVGVKAKDIEIVGALTPVFTRGEVRIYPWVGLMSFPYSFVLNPQEVERVMFLPVSLLLSEGLPKVNVAIEGFTVQSIGITVEKELVWGATAKMLEQLIQLLS
jgi:8-oxo-dGTP pyrophosphatase MutT (NUDIX family)